MSEHAAVIDVSRYYPAPGRRDDLLNAMHRVAEVTGGSPGCFGAQVCQSDRDGDALVAISRWESAAALNDFASSPDFVRQREEMAQLLARPAEREHYQPF